MILTGKTKEDFIEWSKKQKDLTLGISNGIGGEVVLLYSNIEMLPKRIIKYLIIDFFDSVGITIDRNVYDRKIIIREWITGNEQEWIIDCDYIEIFNNSFANWYSEAIEKVNEIYNKLC